MALSVSGPTFSAVTQKAAANATSPSVSNQDDPDNVTVLAKALVYARTGDLNRRNEVINALTAVQSSQPIRALALGRELAAYILAADFIDYRDPAFVNWVARMRVATTTGGPTSLIACHAQRPNNWGTHCGASRLIADVYLGNADDFAVAARIWQGWLGDRTAYATFEWGSLDWQCDETLPVGINPECVKEGVDIGGVLPDDQRRAENNPFPSISCENYVHEALQGTTLAAAVLTRHGYPAFNWSDRAIVRSYEWLYAHSCAPEGEDTFAPFIVNHFAGTDFDTVAVSTPGKNFGFSDWLWP